MSGRGTMRAMLAFCGVLSLTAAVALAADVSAGVDFANAYVFRGETLNEGWVAQPSLDASGSPKVEGLSVGVWANFDIEDDVERGIEDGQVSEVDLYASYELPAVIEQAEFSVGYTEYTYPNAAGEAVLAVDGTATVEGVDADREVNLIANAVGCPLNPSLGLYYGIDGAVDESFYAEASFGHVHNVNERLSASASALVGYLSPDVGDDGISHVQLTGGVGYGGFTALVSYIVETDDDVLAVDEEVVVTLGASADF